jgi:hypothetical protein
LKLNSTDIIYSEHGVDECFEFKNGQGRVPEGDAVGFIDKDQNIVLFNDIVFSKYDHSYWDNYDLEQDDKRLFLP